MTNETPTVNFTATPGRLDAALSAESGVSRSQVAQWIEAGLVLVNGQVALKAGLKLRGGEHVQAAPPPPTPSKVSAENVPLDVVFEDEHLIAVNKPPGMVTHPAGALVGGTLVNALLGRMDLPEQEGALGPDGYRPGIVHRLDKDTSGVIVVAKTVAAHARLAAAFKDRETQKTYLAVSGGSWEASAPVRVNAAIGRHPAERQRMTVGGVNAREAQTTFTPLARVQAHGRVFALVRCEPRTGRTHQIRVHLAHLGSPIVGDITYGRASEVISRQALHAWQLRIPHPESGELLHLVATPPDDMLAAWVALGGVMPGTLTDGE